MPEASFKWKHTDREFANVQGSLQLERLGSTRGQHKIKYNGHLSLPVDDTGYAQQGPPVHGTVYLPLCPVSTAADERSE